MFHEHILHVGDFQNNEANNINIDLREYEGSFKHRLNGIMF